MQYDAKQYDAKQYDAIRCDAIKYNTIPCNTMIYHVISYMLDGSNWAVTVLGARYDHRHRNFGIIRINAKTARYSPFIPVFL